MIKRLSLVAALAFASCGDDHSDIVRELTKIYQGQEFFLERQTNVERNFPFEGVRIDYGRGEGLSVAQVRRYATFMLGTSYVDKNFDGRVDLEISIRRHGVLGPEDKGLDLTGLTGHECESSKAKVYGSPELKECYRLEQFKKGQALYEKEAKWFLKNHRKLPSHQRS